MSQAASACPVRYKSEGEVSTRSTLTTLLMGMVAGVLCGVMASVAGYYGFYILILMPILIESSRAVRAKSLT